MKSQLNYKNIQQDFIDTMSYGQQVDVLLNIIKNMFEEGNIKSRIIKYKLENYINSDNYYRKLYAVNRIISEGKGVKVVPDSKNINDVLMDTNKWITDCLARKYVESKIESEVESTILSKQDKYVEEMRLGILKKQKGPENAKTLKKYAQLEVLDSKKLTKNILSLLRPDSFSQIIGQDRAIKSLITKLASPYPQHIILYGPPGVGKTTAARLALDEAKKLKYTPFAENAKFVEVDGTTIRWDPREITNPLLGSVHDPIYQGSKRDLADVGIPEPKPGLVTEAHGGVLFIDEIGELDEILQNKLLKVLEDKRVEFSSSYYDPDDDNTPKYVKYLFDNGAPADFLLIGATTKEPSQINPALRSRCTEVYFEPLCAKDIEKIVIGAAEKLNVKLEKDVPVIISRYTIEGRKAINILADAYGYVLYNNMKDNEQNEESHKIININQEKNSSHELDNNQSEDKNIIIKVSDISDIISISRLIPIEEIKIEKEFEVGHTYGLGVRGFIGSTIEIEAMAFPAKEAGKGQIRFNDTAGSMAKDSVFNAATVIRKITDKDIKDFDIHVNAIGGGNIDGPSAGAAITICIISALLNKSIRQDIAITGEISLRGNVKPVGGIFEKIYGARRKGIKTIIIPEDNLKEVPIGLKDISIKSVSTIEDLMKIVFV